MHHFHIDRYSDLKSPIHSLDARAKLAFSFIAIFCIVSLPRGSFPEAALFSIIVVALWIASGVPLRHVISRLALVLPFAAIMSIPLMIGRHDTASSPMPNAIFVIIKAALSIVILTLITSTTRFDSLLHSLSSMGMPAIIVSLISFLYSFIFIAIDEMERLAVGRESRELGGNRRLSWKSRGWVIGTFLLRSIERSERVYGAMISRGFSGDMKRHRACEAMGLSDIAVAGALSLSFIAVRFGASA
jgi:cobalt/nickel transport system permease protein